MKRLLVFILFSLSLVMSSFAGHVDFVIKPLGEDGEIVVLSWAKVSEGGIEVDLASCDKVKGIEIKLEFDKEYTIQLQSKYYETFEITFNTYVSADDKGYNYENSISLPLVKRKSGFKIKYKNPPVSYKFSTKKLNFVNENGYTANYEFEPLESEKPKEEVNSKDEIEVQEPEEEVQKQDSQLSAPDDKPNAVIDLKDSLKKENETKEKKQVKEKPQETVVQKNEEVEDLYDPQKVEVLNEAKPKALERNRESKTRLVEMYDELYEQQEKLIMDRKIKAKTKRQFLEEISDGRIEMKKTERNYQLDE